MKEASGELSMTAVAVVAIAAVGVLFTTVIWPTISKNLKHSQACSAAYGCKSNNDGTATCYTADSQNDCTKVGGNYNSGKCAITCDDPDSKGTTE